MSDDPTQDPGEPVPPLDLAATLLPDAPADMNGAATLPPSTQGTSLGPDRPQVPGYEIFSELGRGGMGVVYEARQIALNRVVALKMILSGAHAGPDALARFRSEAESVARLQHPGIVQVYEVGEHGGLPYFSLEFVDGGSLDQKLAGTPQPPRASAELVRALALAVHAAHQKGVVHRDLKPANVLLTADGTLKVTDFGLAKQVDSDGGQTRSGAIIGTPSYMAPEQAGGHVRQIGPASDVYALGAILYECLTGRPPFRAATPLDTVLQVISEEPVAPTQLQPKLPRDLETICLQCLRKEPKKRYASAQELADELGRFLDGDPILARPISWPERALRWVRKNPGKATALAAAVFTVCFVIGVQYQANRQEHERAEAIAQARDQATEALADARLRKAEAERSAAEARQARNQAEAARGLAVTAQQDAQRAQAATVQQLYAARINLAYREWQQNSVNRTEQLLNECPQSLHGWEWYYLKGLCRAEKQTVKGHLQLVRRWRAHEGEVSSLAFSRNGRRLATGSQDHSIRLWDLASFEELLVLRGHTEAVLSLAYSPDGRELVSGSGDQSIKVWDLSERRYFGGDRILQVMGVLWRGEPLGLPPSNLDYRSFYGHVGPTRALAFSPDSRLVATLGNGDGRVMVWDLAANRVRNTFPMAWTGYDLSTPVFGPDGKQLLVLAYGQNGAEAQLWDLASRRDVLPRKVIPGDPAGAVFLPDGKTVVVGIASHRSTRLAWWALPGGKEVAALDLDGERVHSLGLTPDGNYLVAGSTERVFVVDPRLRQIVRSFKVPGHKALAVGRGALVATAHEDAYIRLYDLATGSLVRELEGHAAAVRTVAFSPDARRLVSAGDDMVIKLWDVATGHELLTFREHARQIDRVAWSPDGRKLAPVSFDHSLKVWEAAPDP
jgi:WD40 repeat protein